MAERPTATEVRRARKADLQAWCEAFGLDAEGKVDELRARLLEYLSREEKAAEAEEVPEAPEPEAEPEEEAEAVEEEEAEDEAEEEPEEGAYAPKAKPKLDPATRRLLRVREEIAKRRPAFHRQEWFRYKRLGLRWRRPDGNQSKLRRHFGYRPNVVSIGYRGPKAVRGLHPSGFREVRVHNVRDLDDIDPKVEAARIAGTVGTRKRLEIQTVADEKGIRVLNRREEE